MGKKLICEIECPGCGELIQIYEMGYTPCKCKKVQAELTVLFEDLPDEDNEVTNEQN